MSYSNISIKSTRILHVWCPGLIPTAAPDFPILPDVSYWVEGSAIDLNKIFWSWILEGDGLSAYLSTLEEGELIELKKKCQESTRIFRSTECWNPYSYRRAHETLFKLFSQSTQNGVVFGSFGPMAEGVDYDSFFSVIQWINLKKFHFWDPFLVYCTEVFDPFSFDIITASIRKPGDLVFLIAFATWCRSCNPKIVFIISEHAWEEFSLVSNLERLYETAWARELLNGIVIYPEDKFETILGIVEAVNGNRPWESVPNLAGFCSIGFFKNIDAPQIIEAGRNRKLHPSLGFLNGYFSPVPIVMLRLSQEKCRWHSCVFCNQNQKHRSYQRCSQDIDLDEFINKIMVYTEMGVKGFALMDEAIDPNVSREIAQRVINLNLRWFARMRFTKAFGDGLAEVLSASGCTELMLGIESGSSAMLVKMHKYDFKIKNHDIVSGLISLRDAGIHLIVSLIFNFPGETAADYKKTLRLKKRISNHMRVTFFNNDFRFLPGSPIFVRLSPPGDLAKRRDVPSDSGFSPIFPHDEVINPAFKDYVTHFMNQSFHGFLFKWIYSPSHDDSREIINLTDHCHN